MQEIIPFKKKIDLKNSVYDISSLSVEHDYTISDNMINGNFIIDGTYRATEASLVDEDFFYKLPFEIGISDRIIKDSVNLGIDDFDYEFNKDTITLNINLILECDERQGFMEENKLDTLIEDLDLSDEKVYSEEEQTKEESRDIDFETVGLDPETKAGNISKEEVANSISGFVSDNKDYVTYKVYIVKEYEDYTSISTKFNIPLKVLEDYNEIKDLKVGDKVIIPYVFE